MRWKDIMMRRRRKEDEDKWKNGQIDEWING